MVTHIKDAIILYTYLIMNCITSNAFEFQSNTGWTLVIRVIFVYMTA